MSKNKTKMSQKTIINVAISVTQNFSDTVQKIQIDEKIFTDDIKKMGYKISYVDDGVTFLEICEKLMENCLSVLGR